MAATHDAECESNKLHEHCIYDVQWRGYLEHVAGERAMTQNLL